MKPVMQTNLGANGDCLRACIASILEVPIEILPEPTPHHHKSEEEFGEYVTLLEQTLARLNCGMVIVQSPGGAVFPGYTIVTHRMKADPRRGHARVAFDGWVVHDPYPNGTMDRLVTETIMDWVILYPLDMTQPFGRQVYEHIAAESGANLDASGPDAESAS